ncbi:MAG: hypothetical protein ACE14L_04885 [Terriglobales bacterium]
MSAPNPKAAQALAVEILEQPRLKELFAIARGFGTLAELSQFALGALAGVAAELTPEQWQRAIAGGRAALQALPAAQTKGAAK